MKNVRTIMAILALAAGSQMLAQGVGEIHGKVLDDAGEALPFCVVRAVQGTNVLGAQTDFEGRFVLKPLPVGAYTVSFQYPAYGTV
jgi:hypothetical protein